MLITFSSGDAVRVDYKLYVNKSNAKKEFQMNGIKR